MHVALVVDVGTCLYVHKHVGRYFVYNAVGSNKIPFGSLDNRVARPGPSRPGEILDLTPVNIFVASCGQTEPSCRDAATFPVVLSARVLCT